MGSARIFWIAMIVVGAGTALIGSGLQDGAPPPAVHEDDLLGFATVTSQDMTGAGIVALGGLITFLGLVGFARGMGSRREEDAARLDPEAIRKLSGVKGPLPGELGNLGANPGGIPSSTETPSDDELIRRLAWPTLNTTTPSVQPPGPDLDALSSALPPLPPIPPREARLQEAETIPPSRPPAPLDERPTAPRRAPPPPTGPVPHDPTTWNHPEGMLFLFDARDPEPFYGLVRELVARRLPGRGLLIARLDAAGAAHRGVVAVLGSLEGMTDFDSVYRQFAGLEYSVRGLDPLKVRPQAVLQGRSYDPAWVVPNPEPYHREREAMRRGRWVLRDATQL